MQMASILYLSTSFKSSVKSCNIYKMQNKTINDVNDTQMYLCNLLLSLVTVSLITVSSIKSLASSGIELGNLYTCHFICVHMKLNK